MQLTRAVMALVGLTFSLFAQIPDFTPPNQLFAAVLRNDVAEVDRLLAEGANPNEGRFIGSPALILALMQKSAPMAKALLEKGADPKGTDGAGSTTLMWAVANETPDVGLVAELLRRGIDPNAANKMGDNALAWAMRRGHTPVMELLKKHGASDQTMVRQSVEKALALLQRSGPEFIKVSGCTSCHHQSLPQMAYGVAREHGFSVDPQFSDKQAKSVIAMFKPYREQMMQNKINLPNPPISVSYSLLGLAAENYPADETTEAMASLLAAQQMPDGKFAVFGARPPMESSTITGTALSIRALQSYGKGHEPRVAKGLEWLRTATPATTEERAMQLLGLVWAKGRPADMRSAAQALFAQQRSDGGWGQLPTLESDAYATGQVLVALHSAGQAATTDATYQRAVSFLSRTQHPDGSWLVRSRAFPFQAYKESGFPHGKHQWISAAGTSWAAMALSLTQPSSAQQLSQLF